MNVMVITHGTFSQHQIVTTNLHLFFRWKTHRWHPCTLVPDSVQQGMKGAGESCGKGLEMRGKKFVSCKRVNSLGMLLYIHLLLLCLWAILNAVHIYECVHCFELCFAHLHCTVCEVLMQHAATPGVIMTEWKWKLSNITHNVRGTVCL